jgi:hypothetical protein
VDLHGLDNHALTDMEAATFLYDEKALVVAIKKELNVLTMVARHRLYVWSAAFPRVTGEETIYT